MTDFFCRKIVNLGKNQKIGKIEYEYISGREREHKYEKAVRK